MRDDIAKVLVTRPRVRGGHGRKGRQLDHEDQPQREGMKEHKGGTKELNEYLSPLKRFVHSQLGRPWDKVFSEISERIVPGNTVQEHILLHLYQYIHVKVVKVPVTEKFPCGLKSKNAMSRWRGGYMTPVGEGELYVDPDDGIIKKAKRRIHTLVSSRRERRSVWLDASHICTQENGIWYSVEAKRFKIEAYRKMVTFHSSYLNYENGRTYERTFYRFSVDGVALEEISDHFFGLVSANDTIKLEKRYGVKGVYGAHRTARQLSSKELKKLGLRNDDDTREL